MAESIATASRIWLGVDFYVSWGEMVDALSVMAHRSEAQSLGREMVKKLKEVIPRQNFQVSLQAAIGGKFIVREDISAYRKRRDRIFIWRRCEP